MPSFAIGAPVTVKFDNGDELPAVVLSHLLHNNVTQYRIQSAHPAGTGEEHITTVHEHQLTPR